MTAPATRARRPVAWPGWLADRRGVAAVEFALVLPLLAMLFLGGYESLQAASTYRKLTDTTVELANVAAQYTSLSASDVTTVMTASSQVMAPYSTTSLTIVLSQITTDASNTPKVAWSQPYNGGVALAVGSTVSMPSGMASPSTSYLLVQTHYAYVPTVGAGFIGAMPMSDQIYMLPRASASIPYTG